MVINQINVMNMWAFESERYSPVSRHGHGPNASPIALQRVQTQARDIHVLGGHCGIQPVENPANLGEQISADLAGIVSLKQPFQPLVPDAPDHGRK
jgi:hypothetical protein